MANKKMNPFADPNLMAILTTNPRTRDFMRDPDYLRILNEIQANPQSLG